MLKFEIYDQNVYILNGVRDVVWSLGRGDLNDIKRRCMVAKGLKEIIYTMSYDKIFLPNGSQLYKEGQVQHHQRSRDGCNTCAAASGCSGDASSLYVQHHLQCLCPS